MGSAVLLLNLLPWSVVLTTVGGMADQYFRNMVTQWMSGPDLFRHLAIDEEEFHAQPLHWRQGLAEIALRKGDEEEALRQFISRLGTRDIEILESVAQHALHGALLASRRLPRGDPIGELSSMDLIHLEAIGVIDSRLPLNHPRIRAATSGAASDENREEFWLAGERYGIYLRAPTDGNGVRLSLIILTDIGKRLVKALRRPTSLPYLCWLQRYFLEQQMSAEIWSIDRDGSDEDYFQPISEITGGCDVVDVRIREAPGNAG